MDHITPETGQSLRIRRRIFCSICPVSRWVALSVALGAMLAGCSLTGPDRLPTRHGSWDQTHQVDVPAGWSITARNVGLGDESTSLSGPGDTGCIVSKWSAKPSWRSRPLLPQRVQVQGFTASYGDLHSDYGPYPRAVVWEDAAGDWFGVRCDLEREGILKMAEGVRTGGNPIQVPFELESVPTGLVMVQLIDSTWDGSHSVTAQFELADSTNLGLEIGLDEDGTLQQGPAERRTLGHREVEIRSALQTICFPSESRPACISGPGSEPASDWAPGARAIALRTAELLTPVDDPDDEDAWLAAGDALPPK